MWKYTRTGHDNGPRASLGQRLVWAVVSLGCLSVLITAATLSANEANYGTHTQLGLPPCGFLMATGLPCLTCGMTTSFTLAVEGRWLEALIAQPMGAVLAFTSAMMVWVAGYAAIAGLALAGMLKSLFRQPVVIVIAVLWIAAWGFKAIMMQA